MRYQLDREFYRSVHELLVNRQAGSEDNRRLRERRAYGQWEAIAPLSGDTAADLQRLTAVRCYDLSEHGFSFFLEHRVPTTQVLAAFAHPSGTIYLIAEVLHQASTIDAGSSGFRIGCRFTGRLTGPFSAQPSPAVAPTTVS